MPADKCCTPDAACHEQLRCLFLHAASIAHDIPIRLSVVLPMFRQLSPVTSLSCVGLHAGKAQAIIISIFTLLVVGGLVLNLSAGSWGPETALHSSRGRHCGGGRLCPVQARQAHAA